MEIALLSNNRIGIHKTDRNSAQALSFNGLNLLGTQVGRTFQFGYVLYFAVEGKETELQQSLKGMFLPRKGGGTLGLVKVTL